MQLKDKVAVVTGGASGLGRAVAELFIKSGAKAVILDLPREENAKNVAALGEHALFAPADVSDETAVNQALDAGLSDCFRKEREAVGDDNSGDSCGGRRSCGDGLYSSHGNAHENCPFNFECVQDCDDVLSPE